MKSTLFCFLLLCAYATSFEAYSPKSNLFKPLRVNKTPVYIKNCGEEVTSDFGILEQTYVSGSAINDMTCTWHLHAPPGYIVNVISIGFNISDYTSPGRVTENVDTTSIALYDGDKPEQNLLIKYFVTPYEKVGQFANSMSTNQDMVVQIKYHDHIDFKKQDIKIHYEYLNIKQVTDILRSS